MNPAVPLGKKKDLPIVAAMHPLPSSKAARMNHPFRGGSASLQHQQAAIAAAEHWSGAQLVCCCAGTVNQKENSRTAARNTAAPATTTVDGQFDDAEEPPTALPPPIQRRSSPSTNTALLPDAEDAGMSAVPPVAIGILVGESGAYYSAAFVQQQMQSLYNLNNHTTGGGSSLTISPELVLNSALLRDVVSPPSVTQQQHPIRIAPSPPNPITLPYQHSSE